MCSRLNQRHFGGKKWSPSSCILLQGRENDIVAETSYHMLDVLSFCDREIYRDRDNIANFSGKKKKVQ